MLMLEKFAEDKNILNGVLGMKIWVDKLKLGICKLKECRNVWKRQGPIFGQLEDERNFW
jgi:hypothetical protein